MLILIDFLHKNNLISLAIELKYYVNHTYHFIYILHLVEFY